MVNNNFYYFLAFFRACAPSFLYIFLIKKVFPSHQSLIAAFHQASSLGHLRAIEFLYAVACDLRIQETMLTSDCHKAFYLAVHNGHSNAIGLIYRQMNQAGNPQKMVVEVISNHHRWSREQNYPVAVNFLWNKAAEQGCDMRAVLYHNDYSLFSDASWNGHINMIQFLWDKALEYGCQREMLVAENYRAFRLASQEGHLPVVQDLYEKAVEQGCQKEMLAARDFEVFRKASEKGHLNILEFLWQEALEHNCQREMLVAENYRAFRHAAQNARMDVMRFLWDKALQHGCHKFMLCAVQYLAFRMASEEGHLAVVQYLYEKAVDLGCQREMLTADDYRAFRWAAGYVHLDVMRFLWDKALEQGCQSNMIAANNYQVYTTAALNHRAEVVGFLEEVASPEQLVLMRQRTAQQRQQIFERVGEQAAAYRPGPDLRAQAANAESAMVGLSPEQIAQLEDIRRYYGAQMNPAAVIAEFRTLMIQKYRGKPAQYGGHHLPLTYEELEVFLRDQSLSSDRHNILKSYYRHEVHTAYRYLLPENPWLHPGAVFGVVIENNIRKKTVFEQHQELIALLFKAASDHDIVSSEVSAEDRLSFFITSFGDIARAHNREATGFATASEADDMQADKPSCSSGILRRLLTAVIGHPLLIPFSAILDTQITEKMKQHLLSKITAGHAQILLDAWNICVEFPEEQSITILKQLDPSEEEFQALVSGVQRDLSAQVVLSQRLTQYVQSPAAVALISSKLRLPAGMPCYAICFAQRVGLQTMLESAVAELGETINNQALLLSAAMPSTDEQSRANRPGMGRKVLNLSKKIKNIFSFFG